VKNVGLSVSAICAALTLAGNVGGSTRPEDLEPEWRRSYNQWQEKIDSLCTGINWQSQDQRYKNLKDLIALGEDVEKEWREKEALPYGYLILKVAGVIANTDLPSSHTFGVSQAMVLKALSRADELPISAETEMVHACQAHRYDRSGRALSGEEYAQLRIRHVRAWLHAYRRLERTLDPKWDPEAEFAPAIQAGALNDPQAGAKHEADKAAWRAYSLEQSEARSLKRYWVPHAQRFLIGTYTKPDASKDELAMLLKEYEIDDEAQAKIMKAVETKTMPPDLAVPVATRPVAH
jgi:hypothetical protein